MVEKILFQHELFGHDRFLVQFTVGTMPHDRIMRSIELFGTEVAPAVREELARRAAASPPTRVRRKLIRSRARRRAGRRGWRMAEQGPDAAGQPPDGGRGRPEQRQHRQRPEESGTQRRHRALEVDEGGVDSGGCDHGGAGHVGVALCAEGDPPWS